MSRKAYFIFNLVTGLLKGAGLLSIVLWLLPRWEINIPVWGLIAIFVAFLTYEIVTFRIGRRALDKKPVIWPEAMAGRCGKATTPLAPEGYVRVGDELWRAMSTGPNIGEGDDIVVMEVKRLTLFVAPDTKQPQLQSGSANVLPPDTS